MEKERERNLEKQPVEIIHPDICPCPVLQGEMEREGTRKKKNEVEEWKKREDKELMDCAGRTSDDSEMTLCVSLCAAGGHVCVVVSLSVCVVVSSCVHVASWDYGLTVLCVQICVCVCVV